MSKKRLFCTVLMLVIFFSGCEKRREDSPSIQTQSLKVLPAKMVDRSSSDFSHSIDVSDYIESTSSQKMAPEMAPLAVLPSDEEEPLPQNSIVLQELSSTEGFALEVLASEGGSARFLEGKEISKDLPQNAYQIKATPHEGYFFDHWEISKGKALSPLTSATMVIEAVEGVIAKATFLNADSLIYVSPAVVGGTLGDRGSRAYPFASVAAAVEEAALRLHEKRAFSVEIRIAMGDYLLKDNGALELIPGISLTGGFHPKTWEPKPLEVITERKVAPTDFSKKQTVIRIGKNFASEAMIFVNAEAKEGFQWKRGEVALSGLVLDGSSRPVVLISATGVTPRITNCILKGYGDSLVSCFDSGAEIHDNQLLCYGEASTAIDIRPVAHPGASISQNLIWVGSASPQIDKGTGIRVYSSDTADLNRIRIAHNQIRSSVAKRFTGIQVDNGLLVCEGNRIETVSKAQGESFGMNLRGEAVVNSNLIMLESKGGYGLALEGNGYPSRILNNTIVTKSLDPTVRMTACGSIDGKNLLISHNIFVNPQEEQSAALGVTVLGSENRVFNNYIISNNEEEKRLVVGFNGNQDQIHDSHVKAAIYESGVEIDLSF